MPDPVLIDRVLEQYEQLNVLLAHSSGPGFLDLDVTMHQARVLYLVRVPGSIPMSDLVAKLGVTVPTVTGIVDRLVERGLVVRRGTPVDRRRVVIEITSAGADLIDGIRELSSRQLRSLLAVLDDEEVACVRACFEALGRGLTRLATGAVPSPADDPPGESPADPSPSRAPSSGHWRNPS